jgi:hypothetical protein
MGFRIDAPDAIFSHGLAKFYKFDYRLLILVMVINLVFIKV